MEPWIQRASYKIISQFSTGPLTPALFKGQLYSCCVVIITCFHLARRDLGLNPSDGGWLAPKRQGALRHQPLPHNNGCGSKLWPFSGSAVTGRHCHFWFSSLPGEFGCEHSPVAHFMGGLVIVICS